MVGLSAQAVLGNMVSGLNLYISRPFVAGKQCLSLSIRLTICTSQKSL